MRLNIFKKRYQYLGLHINMHALKALQFDSIGGKTVLHAYSNTPTPRGLINNDDILDRKKLSEFIRTTLAKPAHGNFSTNRAVVCIPESKSYVRVMEMEQMDEEKAELAIMYEAEAYIPMPMDQVYFDWDILSKNGKTMSVLLTASQKEYVDTLASVIENAGLVVCGMEVEAQSVAHALVPPSVKEPVLIVDIDAFKTDLVIVENGALQFTSSVPVAGNMFTESLAKALGVTTQVAEKLKREVGFANTVEYPNLKSSMISAVENFAAEIKNILKFHYDHADSHISQIIITGGGAKMQHMTELLPPLLEAYAPVTVTVANPLEHVPNLMHNPLTPYEALSFTNAIGLAMWEMEV